MSCAWCSRSAMSKAMWYFIVYYHRIDEGG